MSKASARGQRLWYRSDGAMKQNHSSRGRDFTTRSTLVAVACVAVLAAGCASAPHRPSPRDPHAPFVAHDGERLMGTYVVASFHVPSGARVLVSDDLVVRADTDIVIEGTLAAVDRGPNAADPARIDAPRIELHAQNRIDVSGAIEGGSGRTFVTEAHQGGRGSTIRLFMSAGMIDGVVRGGAGGDGGPGHSGGSGGDVLAFGPVHSRVTGGHTSARGGEAGRTGPAVEGRPAPNGAEGGAALLSLDPNDPRWK